MLNYQNFIHALFSNFDVLKSGKGCFLLLLLLSEAVFSQSLIAEQGFETSPALSVLTYSATGGNTWSGNSAADDGPVSSPFYADGQQGFGVNNGTAVLTFPSDEESIDIHQYLDISLSFNLASFSLGSRENGVDVADFVLVEISTDGVTYSEELKVTGNRNAYWSYSATGTVIHAYNGNNSPTVYAPSTGGNRTDDGYSTLSVTSIPPTSTLKVRITLKNNNNNELWVIDQVKIAGTPNLRPTLNIGDSTTISFEGIVKNTSSAEKSYMLSGFNLTAPSGNINVTVPAGYQVASVSGGPYSSGISIPYSSSILDTTPVYIVFTPSDTGNFTGDITSSGGGTSASIAVSGMGTLPSFVSAFSVGNITDDRVQLTWTKPSGIHGVDWDGVIIFARASSSNEVSVSSADGSSFGGGGNVYGSGTLVDGSFVVSNTTTDADGDITITGLTQGSYYYFIAYTYKVISGGSNDTWSLASSGIQAVAEVQNVIGLTADSGDSRSIVSWDLPGGTIPTYYDEIMLVGRMNREISFTPSGDGTDYKASTTFGNGTDLGSGQYVLYKGSAANATVTNLVNGSTYYFSIYTRKGRDWSSGVSVSATPSEGITYYSRESGMLSDAIWSVSLLGGIEAISFSSSVNIVVQDGHTVELNNSSVNINNIKVENGGKLWANSTHNTYFNLFGNILCDGEVGGVSDGIGFNIEDGDHYIEGDSGTFIASRIRKSDENNASGIGTLSISRDVSLNFSGTCLYNNRSSSTIFNVIIDSGARVTLTDSAGAVCMDGTGGNSVANAERGGSYFVKGSLIIPDRYYAETNNKVTPVNLKIDSGGVVQTGFIEYATTGNGAAGHTITVDNGGTLTLTGATDPFPGFNKMNAIHDLKRGSIVQYQASASQLIQVGLDYSNLILIGSGNKSFSGLLNVGQDLIIRDVARLNPSGSDTIHILGDWINHDHSGFSARNSTVIFNGANQNISSGDGKEIFNHLVFSNSGIKSLPTDSITVKGNLILSDSAILNAVGKEIILEGDWANYDQTGFMETGSTVLFKGANSEIYTPRGERFANVLVEKNSGTVLSLFSDVTVSGTLTLKTGRFSVGMNTLTLSGSPVAGIASNLKATSASSLVFGGSSEGVFIPSTILTLSGLTIDNTNNVSMGSSLTLSGTLMLSSGSLILGSNTLTANHDLISNGGTLSGSAVSTLIIGDIGSVSGNLSFADSADSLKDFSVGKSVGLGSPLVITGVLKLNEGDFQTNENSLILNLDSGYIDKSGNGTLTGRLTVEKTLSHGGYTYLGTCVDRTDLSDFMHTEGIEIGKEVYQYDENRHLRNDARDQGWKMASGLQKGRGYGIYYPSGGVVDLTGIYTHGVDTSIVITNTRLTGDAPGDAGWNLVSNPFPSALDWDILAPGLTDQAIYYYNGSRNIAYNAGIPDSLGVIPPLQGFWVHCNDSERRDTLVFSNSARGIDSRALYRRPALKSVLNLRVSDQNGRSDNTYLRILDQATLAFDGAFDAFKRKNDQPPAFYSVLDSQSYSINAIPGFYDRFIPLKLEYPSTVNLSITAIEEGPFNSEIDIVLYDSFLNYYQSLRESPVYAFTYTPADTDRFFIGFKTMTITSFRSISPSSILLYGVGERVVVDFGAMNPDQSFLTVYDLTGKELILKDVSGQNRVSLVLPVRQSGVYLAKLLVDGKLVVKKVFLNKE